MSRPQDWWVLDLDGDPTPGDCFEIGRCGRQFLALADDAERADGDVRSLASAGNGMWDSNAGDAFAGQVDELPGQLAKLHTSYRMAGDAIMGYRDNLYDAQDQADTALHRGREARGRLDAAQARADDAGSWLTQMNATVRDLDTPWGPAPDPEQVRSALRNQAAAQARADAAAADVDAAATDLDAARSLALQAQRLRDDAAADAKDGIDAASDAGIKNDPWWKKVGDFLADVWDVVVVIAKVAVVVLAVVAMFVPGLNLLVLGLAAIVLADAVYKLATGQGSWVDVAFAVLDCIPGMRAVTSIARLGKLGNVGAGIVKGADAFNNTGLGTALTSMGRSLRTGAIRARVRTFGYPRVPRSKVFSQRVMEHLFRGHTKPNGKVTGVHYRAGGVDPPGRTVTRVTPNDPNGLYKAAVVDKNAKSTMFPDHWTQRQVVDAAERAYQGMRPLPGDPWKYEGIADGVRFRFQMQTGSSPQQLATFYPMM